MPELLEPFAEESSILVKKGAVGAVEFSGGTYQVQVVDPKKKEDCWAFLQFDDKNRLTDCFCSCEGEGELGACVHLGAAYLSIFDKGDLPLHIRFQESLWNRLCFFFADDYGDDPSIISQNKKGVFSLVREGKELFSAIGSSPAGKERLQKIFLDRLKETEETSLKFSNLSEEEIRQWKQGRPSSHLKYELSFWNDLAKWLMTLQDLSHPFSFEFFFDEREVPDKLSVTFSDAAFTFSITGPCLNSIIPSLSSIDTGLHVLGRPEDAIETIIYNKEKGELRIFLKEDVLIEKDTLEKNKRVILEDWVYMPKKAFYPRKLHPLLEQSVYTGNEIGRVFEDYFTIIKSKLSNVKILEETVSISYTLDFDREWNLRIQGYVEKPKDLQKPQSQFFGEWAFLEPDRFVHLEGIVFDQALVVVPEAKVGAFASERRAWLNEQKGFRTHITGVETKLSYLLREDRSILFSRIAILEDGATLSKDFGPWVYIKDEGFYSKAATALGIPIQSGVVIKGPQVPQFIKMYSEELQLIPGFFSQKCPVIKSGLIVQLEGQQKVLITPQYVLNPDYREEEVLFFEDHTFVKGEGFHRLPVNLLLPERFRHPLELEKEHFPRFFTQEMDKLREHALSIDPKLIPPKKIGPVAKILSKGDEGYRLDLNFISERGVISFSELWEACRHKERFVFSEAGLIDLHDERYNWIGKIQKEKIDREKNQLVLSTLELIRLNAFDPLEVSSGEDLLKELMEFRSSQVPTHAALKSKLRPYQEIGFHWLWFLYTHGLSGLLCDDMGLGKTHQAMALMAAAFADRKKPVHYLVVCPTSVIYHWEEKLRDFLPGVRVCTFHGTNRSFEDFHEEYDILLTSYGIWRNENDLLNKVSFDVAIFDEIQSAKNQSSRIHASLLRVKARMRLGLTGTPIENRLLELKALFDIILPTFMPSENEFKQFFVIPIEKGNDRVKKDLLARVIKPFVLRRKKEDVLFDLPDKVEEIAHCELSLDQRLLYHDLLQKVRDSIFRDLEDTKTPVPYLHIFSALSSLKQICNHPAAFLKIPDEYENYTSGKWDLFVELLSEGLESGQKVVVFSQYLAMLDIFEKYLRKRNVEFASIRGATVKRGEEIRRFNQNPSCEVFVGSLHAAGLGIDLTAGSVVIHYDRWWNAAREDQATDRVHRIGQVRNVQVFKLVTKGTFEEKIDEMITRKGKLMEDVVGVDDWRFMKEFNREEIYQLFRDLKE